MFLAHRPARPLRKAAHVSAALLALAGLGVGLSAPALAQAAKKPAAPAAPAPAPAAPAQQQGGTPTPAAQTGPQVINVKSEPSQAEWTKVCGKDNGSGTDICYTTRDFVSDNGQPVLAAAVYEMKNAAQKQEARVVRFLLPLGLMLGPGIRFNIDGKDLTAGKFAVCFPNGCFAEAPISGDVVGNMKKGTTLNVGVQNQTQKEVIFAVPLAGFGKSFDGPAIDPKVLEEQQKKLQAELEKRSEEMRKKLEAQGGAAGSATAPAANAAPKP